MSKTMEKSYSAYQCWLASVVGISAKKKIALLEAVTEKELYEMSELQLMELCVYYDVDSQCLLESRRMGAQPEQIQKQMEEEQIQLVTFQGQGYPRKLKYIKQMPYALYYKGQLPGDEVSVAIVGARKCSEYGRHLATELGKQLACHGVPVISGLAYGIDCASHSGSLSVGGKTFGVLGCGVDLCYPSASLPLYQMMTKEKGGVLSEYAPGTQPMPKFFPARNRIISGLSDIVIVVEARLRSGSLITADFAMDQGKEVYAVPGRITDKNSQGTNRLIYQGAGILDDVEQFLEDMNLVRCKKADSKAEKNFILEKEEVMLYSGLDFEPKHLDIIIEETGWNVSQVLAVIDSLKHRKLVKELYKNYFCKTS